MNRDNLSPLASILHWYSLATEKDIFEGVTWYNEAHAFSEYLAATYQVDTATAAFLLAVFSPQLGWSENKKRADKFLFIYCNKGNVYKSGLGFKTNIKKALAIVKGDLDALSGQKVTAFAHCILKNGFTDRVCIDRHAQRIAGKKDGHTPSPKQYLALEAAYQVAALEINRQKGTHYTAAQIQAITWVTYRRINNLSVYG